MRLLIVEDAPNIVQALRDDLGRFLGADEITVCQSRDAAYQAIGGLVFDYAILDLKIPTIDEKLDAEVDHGKAVYEKLRAESPGTQVCFLTGFATEDFFTDISQQAERIDVWGSNEPQPMVTMYKKSRLSEIADLVNSVKCEIRAIEDIEIIGNPHPAFPEDRILRVFGRRHDAASLLVDNLSGGLSNVRVLRVQLRDRNGVVSFIAAARVGSRLDIRKEIEGYQRYVVRLPNGSFPAYTGEVVAGAGPSAGVFYKLISEFQPLSTLISTNPNQAAAVVQRLQRVEEAWTRGHPHVGHLNVGHLIADVRRKLVSDDDMVRMGDQLAGIRWEEFESRAIQVRSCCQHGDCHCDNVLVDPDGDPVIIDFASVGEGPASLDPVSLELSPLFHPSRWVGRDWPTIAQAGHWDDLDQYLVGCPIEAFVRAARQWAHEVAAGNRELYAVAYAYCARQLKYLDTDKDLARAIIGAVIEAFRRT
jgi:CheY-like chemotaxis protein